MAKSKEGKDVEFYLGQIRSLKAENRNLKKRLRQYEKREHYLEEKELEHIVEEEIISKERCKECNKGFMEEVNILDRIFKKCSTCGHRTRARKVSSSESNS